MGLASVLVSCTGILIIGFGMSSGIIPIDMTTMTNSTRFEAWVMASTLFLVIGSIMVICPGMLQNRLQKTIEIIQEQKLKLQDSNEQLNRALKERKEMEAQVIKSEKMEVLGRLAGGVAHDLNNILSAHVSYPDLILMDLPEDSPFKELMEKIKESGLTAAAIVDDLLTMARRGVVVTDILNLNTIVENYILSPEWRQLKKFHPDVTLKKDLSTDLSNIMGSSMHLFKAVMNLINNAAEAMPNGGPVVLSTRNQRIDKPTKGVSRIDKGDYAVLTVADVGTGIAQQDIEQIFEPFYTKKVMGRSGTGLGMAVVWGTVKDHHGFIDVQSTVNQGTTFSLYFPAIRKEINKEKMTLPVKDYMGNGESILIVDDVEIQRETATALLDKLGYTVTAVESGEKAVNYMQNNRVDLIVLDMIMDPGIDGYQTYQQILKRHPKQKAVIASGFSETARVKETQKLGAGEYIKKPYTFEKIGLAVKQELER
jgi:signal transduction histidine kinase